MVAGNVTDQRSGYGITTSHFNRSSYTQMNISAGTNLKLLKPFITLSSPITATQVTSMAVSVMPIVPIRVMRNG